MSVYSYVLEETINHDDDMMLESLFDEMNNFNNVIKEYVGEDIQTEAVSDIVKAAVEKFKKIVQALIKYITKAISFVRRTFSTQAIKLDREKKLAMLKKLKDSGKEIDYEAANEEINKFLDKNDYTGIVIFGRTELKSTLLEVINSCDHYYNRIFNDAISEDDLSEITQIVKKYEDTEAIDELFEKDIIRVVETKNQIHDIDDLRTFVLTVSDFILDNTKELEAAMNAYETRLNGMWRSHQNDINSDNLAGRAIFLLTELLQAYKKYLDAMMNELNKTKRIYNFIFNVYLR